MKMDLKTTTVLLLISVSGCLSLKCKVGVGSVTKEINCTGDWDTMKSQLTAIGGNVTDFSKIFNASAILASGSDLLNSGSSLLNTGVNSIANAAGRRKRQAESEATTVAAAAGAAVTTTAAAAVTTTESADAYYCLKHTLLGQTVRSCAPKSVLGIAKALCQTQNLVEETCACNSMDLCNSGRRGVVTGVLVAVGLLAARFM